ncbi:MAG: hypothetical protein JO307_24020 [Bryobacterales bacterium]|nr:hypothetical protein [Bryobacterales bacterium]MBV9396905.1 hypothetical protein [Bryobacterales bacterium]
MDMQPNETRDAGALEMAEGRRGTAALLDDRGTADRAPVAGTPNQIAPALFAGDEASNFRSQWEKIQIHFVDQPRESVQQADELVAQAIKRLTEMFAHERDKLEREWDRGDNVSTEDLRVALQRYRAFFDRLLNI